MHKDLDEVKEGPIVAVQYPSVAPFSVNESMATELSVKYSHLKDLDADDKSAYKELVAAIKDVSSNRIQITKEEDAVKKPLNAFRKLVLDTGKALRAAFEPIENSLKAEKDRIDTVLADREAAKRKVWQDNLNELRSISDEIDREKSIDNLQEIDGELVHLTIDYETYGDMQEEAEHIADNLSTKCDNAIRNIKEKAEFEAKRIAFEREQAEAAERERLANEEREAMLKQIADLKKAAEPAPEIQQLKPVDHKEVSNNKNVVIERPQAPPITGQAKSMLVGGRGSGKTASVFNEISKQAGSDVRIDVDGSVMSVDMASTPDESAFCTVKGADPIEVVNDGVALGMFIAALGRANNMRVISHSKEENEAVERVKSTLVKAIGYLNGFDGE